MVKERRPRNTQKETVHVVVQRSENDVREDIAAELEDRCQKVEEPELGLLNWAIFKRGDSGNLPSS